jgi:hypothetical protein
MSQLQIGPGYTWITDNSVTPAVKRPLALLESGKVAWKSKQEFVNGNMQIESFAANMTQEITGEYKFRGIDLQLMRGLWLSQFSGAPVVSNIYGIDVPFTATLLAVSVTAGTSVIAAIQQVRYQASGLPMVRVAAAPTVGQYIVAGEGTATVTITLSAADTGVAVFVTFSKVATTETNKVSIINAIPQAPVYFGVDGVGLYDGKQVSYSFTRGLLTDPPSLFNGADKFEERDIKVKFLADPYTGAVGTISLTEVAT